VRGLDLRDLFTGAMTWRRFAVTLRGLPPESLYKTALATSLDFSELPPPEGNVYPPFSLEAMLQARIGDLIERWIWMNADPEKRPAQPPPPYPRPGVQQSNVRAISEEAAMYLEYVREHHGEHPPDDWKPALA
jgi:hypothetical protein